MLTGAMTDSDLVQQDGVNDHYYIDSDYNYTKGYDNITRASTVGWMSSVSVNYSVEMMTVVSVLLFAVIIVTAVGNAMVGVALFRYRQLRTVSNYLIGNLALSDFLLATTIFPLSTVNESLGYWPFGKTLCHVWLTLDVLYCTASIWNLCVIAFDRFTATVYPVWYRGLRSAPGRQAAIYAVVVWTVAATVCVPPLLGWNAGDLHDFDADIGVYKCILFQSRGYVIYSASGSFFLPFVVTLFLYLGILIVLRGRMHKSSDAKGAAVTAKSNAQKAIATKTWKPVELKDTGAPSLTVIKAELASTLAGSCPSIVNTQALQVPGTSGDRIIPKVDSFYHLDVDDDENETPMINVWNGDMNTGESQPGEIIVTPRPSPSSTHNANLLTVTGSGMNSNTTGNGSALLQIPSTVKGNSTLSPETEVDNLEMPRPLFGLRSSSSFCLSPFVRRKSPCAAGVDQEVNVPDHNSVEAQQRRQRASYERREMRATIRMAIIIAFFCGFWLGFFVVYLVQGCCPGCSIPRALDAFFFWLGYSNSSVNPILYTIFNDEFRGAFLKILGIGDKNKNKKQQAAKR